MVSMIRRLLRSILESEAAHFAAEATCQRERADAAEVQLEVLSQLRVGSKLERTPRGWRVSAVTDSGHIAVGEGPTASLATHHSGA